MQAVARKHSEPHTMDGLNLTFPTRSQYPIVVEIPTTFCSFDVSVRKMIDTFPGFSFSLSSSNRLSILVSFHLKSKIKRNSNRVTLWKQFPITYILLFVKQRYSCYSWILISVTHFGHSCQFKEAESPIIPVALTRNCGASS
jgi:hypothetical protein